jgi:hypothetical protein
VNERCLGEAQLAVDGVWDPERAEHGLERVARPVVARDDEPDPLGRHAAAGEREHLFAHQLERAATSGSLEEADDAVERGSFSRLVGEQRPLEMCECRWRDRRIARGQLLDGAGCETGEILGGSPQRGEDRPPRLVREGDGDLGPRGQRLEQGPLGTREILEPIGEDRIAMPRVELCLEALDCVAAKQATVPASEPGELVAVTRVERAELACHGVRREQPLVELTERPLEGVHEAGMRRGACVAVELCALHDSADEKRLLHASEPAQCALRTAHETIEQVVEGADRAAEQRWTPLQKLALDPVDVRPVRHDEYRLPPVPGVEHGEITVEQELDLARVGRARDKAERHPPTLARARDGL